MAYEGRVYETQGMEAIGVHAAEDIRLLSPVSRPPSVRIFRPEASVFDYANPISLAGPGFSVKAGDSSHLSAVVGLVAIIGGHGQNVAVVEADDLILGFSLAISFRRSGEGGQPLDAGLTIGPFLVTPDDFEDEVISTTMGRHYRTALTVQVNSQDVETIDLTDRMGPPARHLAACSTTAPLLEGDVILLGCWRVELEPGDEVKVGHRHIGHLTARVAP